MPLYEFEGKCPAVHPKAFVHPQAALIGDVEVAEDCYVGAGAVLRGDIGSIRLGTGSNVQENCSVHTYPDESTILHPGVHVGHGAVLHGCEIHSKVLIGMGSILSDRVKVDSRCIIGAASFVPFGMEIPPDSLVMGSPAKIVRSITPDQLEQIERGLRIYQGLARRYLKSFREMD